MHVIVFGENYLAIQKGTQFYKLLVILGTFYTNIPSFFN